MSNHHRIQLIDQIYAAALDVSVWPEVLESMERMFGCIASGIYTVDLGYGRVSLTKLRGIDPDLLKDYIGHYLNDNPWREVPVLQRQGCVRIDSSLDKYHKKPGFYHKTALYNEWMEPQDFIYTLGVNLHVDDQAQTKCFLYRPRQLGAFSEHDVARFTWIGGHLINAVRVARRLSIQASATGDLFEVIDRIAFGVVFLDEAGHIVQANPFAEDLLRRHDGLVIREAGLVASHRDDNGRLQGAIRCALAARFGSTAGRAHLVSLRRPDGRQPLCATVIPLSCQTRSPFLMMRAVAALILNDPEREPGISTDWLQQRYGLTATEARLTQNLSQGSTLRQAAECVGLTYETARWYLKSIFQKTGTDRQAELIRLLLSEQMVIGQNSLR